jgi:hypothetical protein
MFVEAGAKPFAFSIAPAIKPGVLSRSGIEEAAKKAGAQVRHIIESLFQTSISLGRMVKSARSIAMFWNRRCYQYAMQTHSISGVT